MKKTETGYADLHVHTSYSDGMLTPQEVVEKAEVLKLKAIAITDHDCIEGIDPAIKAARGTSLEVVPGVEISAAVEDKEIHILGYFIDWKKSPIVDTLTKMKANRVERMEKILSLLKKQGLEISEEKVFGTLKEGTVGRLHLARIMVEQRMVRNIHEAFDRYIGDGKPCHIKHKRLDFSKAIKLIRDSGGVPVIAHPGTMGYDKYFPIYIEKGLRGVEAFHSKHNLIMNNKYVRLAKKYGLLVTGGSDCHGMGPGKILIGKTTVSCEILNELREEAKRIKAEQG